MHKGSLTLTTSVSSRHLQGLQSVQGKGQNYVCGGIERGVSSPLAPGSGMGMSAGGYLTARSANASAPALGTSCLALPFAASASASSVSVAAPPRLASARGAMSSHVTPLVSVAAAASPVQPFLAECMSPAPSRLERTQWSPLPMPPLAAASPRPSPPPAARRHATPQPIRAVAVAVSSFSAPSSAPRVADAAWPSPMLSARRHESLGRPVHAAAAQASAAQSGQAEVVFQGVSVRSIDRLSSASSFMLPHMETMMHAEVVSSSCCASPLRLEGYRPAAVHADTTHLAALVSAQLVPQLRAFEAALNEKIMKASADAMAANFTVVQAMEVRFAERLEEVRRELDAKISQEVGDFDGLRGMLREVLNVVGSLAKEVEDERQERRHESGAQLGQLAELEREMAAQRHRRSNSASSAATDPAGSFSRHSFTAATAGIEEHCGLQGGGVAAAAAAAPARPRRANGDSYEPLDGGGAPQEMHCGLGAASILEAPYLAWRHEACGNASAGGRAASTTAPDQTQAVEVAVVDGSGGGEENSWRKSLDDLEDRIRRHGECADVHT